MSVDLVCGAGIGNDGNGGGRMVERAVRSYGNIVRKNMCRRWRWSDIRDFDLCVRYSIYCCEGHVGEETVRIVAYCTLCMMVSWIGVLIRR